MRLHILRAKRCASLLQAQTLLSETAPAELAARMLLQFEIFQDSGPALPHELGRTAQCVITACHCLHPQQIAQTHTDIAIYSAIEAVK